MLRQDIVHSTTECVSASSHASPTVLVEDNTKEDYMVTEYVIVVYDDNVFPGIVTDVKT